MGTISLKFYENSSKMNRRSSQIAIDNPNKLKRTGVDRGEFGKIHIRIKKGTVPRAHESYGKKAKSQLK